MTPTESMLNKFFAFAGETGMTDTQAIEGAVLLLALADAFRFERAIKTHATHHEQTETVQ